MPAVQPGHGPIVTGTFRRASAQVVDVQVAGLDEPIGATGNHPFWSADRQQFVRADALRPGERVRTARGVAEIVAVESRAEPAPVYNLEVQGTHVYQVAASGVLVHNGAACNVPPPGGPSYRIIQNGGTTITQATANALNKSLGKNLNKREWGRGIEELKGNVGLPKDYHGMIDEIGNYLSKSRELFGNILEYLP